MLSINLDIDYSTNPKVERLTEILGDGSEIHLIRLWCYCAKHCRKNGGREDWTEEALEATMRWCGEKGLLIATLLKLKLIHRWKNGFKVHDWKQHAAHLISYDDLCEMNRKKAKNGWKKRRKAKQVQEKGEYADGIANGNAENTKRQCQNKTKQNKTTIEVFEPSSTAIHEASFSEESRDVFAYWVDAKNKVGLRTLTSQEKPDAHRAAAYILADVFTLDDLKLAIDNLMADEKSREMYGLRGLVNNIDKWVNRIPEKPKQPERFGLPLREIMTQQGITDVG